MSLLCLDNSDREDMVYNGKDGDGESIFPSQSKAFFVSPDQVFYGSESRICIHHETFIDSDAKWNTTVVDEQRHFWPSLCFSFTTSTIVDSNTCSDDMPVFILTLTSRAIWQDWGDGGMAPWIEACTSQSAIDEHPSHVVSFRPFLPNPCMMSPSLRLSCLRWIFLLALLLYLVNHFEVSFQIIALDFWQGCAFFLCLFHHFAVSLQIIYCLLIVAWRPIFLLCLIDHFEVSFQIIHRSDVVWTNLLAHLCKHLEVSFQIIFRFLAVT